MRTVWKFPVNAYRSDGTINDEPEITMPAGAKVVHVGEQEDVAGLIATIWAEVDTDAPRETRCFAIVGTGHPIPDAPYQHVGSWLAEPFVWHLYEHRGDTP